METSDSNESSKAISRWISLMPSSLQNCYELTEQLVQLSRIQPSQVTDEQSNEINELLEARQKLLGNLKKPSNNEEQQMVNRLLEDSRELNQNLVGIKKHIQSNIQNLKKKKVSNKQYLGYNTIGADSYFYDKKK